MSSLTLALRQITLRFQNHFCEYDMRLLHIDSSPNESSVSRMLSAALVKRWCEAHPATHVIHRDLGVDPPASLSAEILRAYRLGTEELNDLQRRELELNEELIQEFLEADIVVVGAPVYNFSVPIQLRAWIDRILMAGRTFRYTEAGSVGMAGNKKVVIVSSCGSSYADQQREGEDFHEAYLRKVFAFVGIGDIDVVRADGLDMGAPARRAALATAQESLERVVRSCVPIPDTRTLLGPVQCTQ